MIIVCLVIGLVVVGLISFAVFKKMKSMPKSSEDIDSNIELASKRNGDQYFISLIRDEQSIDHDLGLRKTDDPNGYRINFMVSRNLPVGYVLANDSDWHARLFKIEFPPENASLENFKIEEVLDSTTTEAPLFNRISKEQLRTFSGKSLEMALKQVKPRIYFDEIYDISPDGNYLLVRSCAAKFEDNNGELVTCFDWMPMTYDVRNKKFWYAFPR